MNRDDLKKFNEGVSYLNRAGKLRECFYPDHKQCKGSIKQAHSLQMNGRLSLLESDVNGQRGIFSLSKFLPSETSRYGHPELLGKKQASTFTGFCDFHDKSLFAPIEDEIQTLSSKQLFLHSYRSFAYWYHKRKELLQAVIQESKFDLVKDLDNNFFISHLQLASESQDGKFKLNDMLVSQSFGLLNYHVHVINQMFPVASSDVVVPYYYLNDQPIYSSSMQEKHAKLMLTVLPGKNETIIIMACLPDDIKASKFINDFKKLPANEFEHKISSLLIYSHGNTFFSPKIWDNISDLNKSFLLSDLNNLDYEELYDEILFKGYYNSDVNLFSFPLINPLDNDQLFSV